MLILQRLNDLHRYDPVCWNNPCSYRKYSVDLRSLLLRFQEPLHHEHFLGKRGFYFLRFTLLARFVEVRFSCATTSRRSYFFTRMHPTNFHFMHMFVCTPISKSRQVCFLGGFATEVEDPSSNEGGRGSIITGTVTLNTIFLYTHFLTQRFKKRRLKFSMFRRLIIF